MDYFRYTEIITMLLVFIITICIGVIYYKNRKASDLLIFLGFLVITLGSIHSLIFYNSIIFGDEPDLEALNRGLEYFDAIIISPIISMLLICIGFVVKLIKSEY